MTQSMGERTNQFAAEICERELSYEDVKALWHAASWHLVHEAVNAPPETVKDRMCEALKEMPIISAQCAPHPPGGAS